MTYNKQTDQCHLGHCALSVLLYAFNKFGDERKIRNRTIILQIFLIQARSLKQWVIVASCKHSGITDTAIGLLIMAVISGRGWSIHFFKSQVGSGSKSHDLFSRLGDYLLDLSLRRQSKHFEHISIKHNICIHGNIAGIIWAIRNDLIPDDCYFPHKKNCWTCQPGVQQR